MLGEDIQHLRVVQLAQGTTGIVDEMLVAVDFVRLADKFRHVLHGRHLGLTVQFLPVFEFLQAEPVLFRVAQFPRKLDTGDRLSTVMLLRMKIESVRNNSFRNGICIACCLM